MKFGVGYYPELVPADEWERDLKLMREAGMDVIRIFDFAWTALEPREGRYDFEWADRFVDMAGQAGLQIILCTPTAASSSHLRRPPIRTFMACSTPNHASCCGTSWV